MNSNCKKLLLSAVAMTMFSSLPVRATNYTWTGASGAWDTTGSWTPSGIPSSGDSIVGFGVGSTSLGMVGVSRTITDLTKDLGGATNATIFNSNTGTARLTLTGNLTLNSGALAIRSNSATALTDLLVQGNINISGGTIRLGNSVTGVSGAVAQLNSLQVDGKTTIAAGSALIVQTNASKTRQMAEVENNGVFSIFRAPSGASAGALSVIGLSGSGTTQVSDEANSIAATLTINGTGAFSTTGIIQNGGAGNALGLLKSNTGTQTLSSASSSYTGNTTINGGVLAVSVLANGGSNSSIGASTNAAGNLVLGGGTLRYTGASASTDRNFTLTSATVSSIDISNASTNLTIAGASANTSGSLTKVGSGTLTLTNVNAHSGATNITAGTLVLSGSGSIGNSSLIKIASGAILKTGGVTGGFQLQNGQKLENKGTFSGALTALNGSTYAPGNSPGIATQDGNLALNTGSNFEWELIGNTASGAGTNFDQTTFASGGLTIQTGVTANLVFNAGSTVDWSNSFWATDQQWLVFAGAASLSDAAGIFTTINVGLDSTGASLATVRAGSTFSFTNSGNDVYLSYTAVPEPSAVALLGCGLLTLVIFRKRVAAI